MYKTLCAAAVMLSLVGSLSAAPVTTSPTTAPTDAAKIAEQLMALRKENARLAKVAHIELSRSISEKPADFSLFADSETPTHHGLLQRIAKAATDREISALLLTIGDSELDMGQAQELRDALALVAKNGKPVVAYADRYSSATYVLATGASDICLLPGGEMLVPGIAVETVFARGLLSKLGVHADMIQIGEYKGAAESLTRDQASNELRTELNRLVDGLYDRLVNDIATRRKLDRKQVVAAIDRAMIPAADAKKLGLVDHVVDIDGLRGLLAEKLKKEVDLIPDYGSKKRDEIDFSNPFAFLHLLTKQPAEVTAPSVALVYVDGMIVEGDGSDGLFGDSLAADGAIREAMRTAQRDDTIKAVVLRINSPGGSALASEAAWQAIRRVSKEKPVIVSIGGMAASGGYYIACAGDRIYADSSAIVGSIGVVGGKLSLKELYSKIGLATETFSRGENAGMFSSSEPFTDAQRLLLRDLMKQTYDQFVDRVMTTRGRAIKDIDQVARGRIFVGEHAKTLGMVDEIGGLEKALAHAGEKSGLGAKPTVRVLPAPKTLADLLSGSNEEVRTPIRSTQMPVELSLLPAGIRKLAINQLTVLRELDRGSVLLVPPAMMRVR